MNTNDLSTTGNLLTDPKYFTHLHAVAQTLSKSNLIPQHYRGPNRVADLVVALDMAQRLRVPPIPFLQATYVAQEGAPMAIEGKLAIALINAYGPFEGLLDWDYNRDADGKIISCTCYGVLKDGSRREVTLNQADLDRAGWGGIYEREKNNRGKWVSTGKRIKDDPNSWWTKTPEQMYAYRTAMFLARRYCPEVVMGMITVDEQVDGLAPGKLEDIDPAMAIPADQIKQLEGDTKAALTTAERLKAEQPEGDSLTLDDLIIELGQKLPIDAPEQEAHLLDYLNVCADRFGRKQTAVASMALKKLDEFRPKFEVYCKEHGGQEAPIE